MNCLDYCVAQNRFTKILQYGRLFLNKKKKLSETSTFLPWTKDQRKMQALGFCWTFSRVLRWLMKLGLRSKDNEMVVQELEEPEQGFGEEKEKKDRDLWGQIRFSPLPWYESFGSECTHRGSVPIYYSFHLVENELT